MKYTNRPVWFEGIQDEGYPVLKNEIETDVVIIGAGITGITAAYLLAKAGKRVTVLEAHKAGYGTTGHSTGNLYITIDQRLASLITKYDEETATSILKSRGGAMEKVAGIIEAEGLQCGFRRVPWVLFSEKEEDDKVIEDEYEALLDCGAEATMDAKHSLPVKVRKAVTLHGQGQLNPLAYVLQLARKSGAGIYEESPATGWKEDDDGIVVKTPSGQVKASYMIMATHTPKGIEMVQTVLGPYREYGVAAPTNGPLVPDGIFWSHGSTSHHSLRNHVIDGKNFLVVIGEHFKTGQHEDTREAIASTSAFMQKCGVETPQFAWGAQHYKPGDGLPYIGRKSAKDRIFYATGFSTDGLTYGTLAAMIIHDEITGIENPFASLYAYNRHRPLKAAGNFIKENLNVAAQYIKDWPGGDADPEGIRPGEGRVLSRDGEKLAVYRDEKGIIKAVSAVCTHMDCIVHFNKAEKSWDCPCHGSRFSIGGEVLEGPALTALKKISLK